MGLVLDEPRDNDTKIEVEGVNYLIDKDLEDRSGGVKVDYVDQGYAKGFVLSATNDLGGGASGCGTSCSC